MSTDSGEKPATSLWSRLIGRRRSPWIPWGIGLLLIVAPLVAAYLDGLLDDLLSQGQWRLILGPALVITYILVVAPIVQRAGAGIIDAFRPLVLIDDNSFDRLIVEASRINPLSEGIAFSLGALFGFWVGWSVFSGIDQKGTAKPIAPTQAFGCGGQAHRPRTVPGTRGAQVSP